MAGGFSRAGLTGSAADGDIPERAAFGPVAATGFTEVPGLGEAVVVEVAELGVGGGTAWARGSSVIVALGTP